MPTQDFSTPRAARRSRVRVRRVARLGLLAAVLACCATPLAGPAGPQGRLDPSAIDEARLVTLAGNTHPKADARHSAGPLEDSFVLEHMQLVLKRSPEQEAVLEAHIDALHDKTSPRYHQWLTVGEFADQYGVSPADIAVVTAWLGAHGLHVDSVPPSRMFIEFSGTAAQVREAFHTQIDRLLVDGVPHIGNRSDPHIPAELAKAVVGVHALHDFMPHPTHKDRGLVRRDHATGKWRESRRRRTSPCPLVGSA